ncbi:MAG: SpoIID/LytB domain-containing protein [Acutalibacteraceae bacterium]|jgi:SpoIID/LytB domain protein
MSVKLSLIALIKEPSVFSSYAQESIFNAISASFPDAQPFKVYQDHKKMIGGLAKAFSDSEVVVLCADNARFLFLKRILFKVLALSVEKSQPIADLIENLGEDKPDKTADSHSLVPVDSTVFLSDDGLYSGFALQSGKQHLIVLPLDLSRIDTVLNNGLNEYITLNILKHGATVTLFAHDTPAAKSSVFPVETKAAMANNKSAAFLIKTLSKLPGLEESLSFVDCDEERKGESHKEHTALLARRAMEKSGATVGLAVSNVLSSSKVEGSLFLFVALADKNRARVAKLYANSEETPAELLIAGGEKLLSMLREYNDDDGFNNLSASGEWNEISEKEVRNRKGLALRLIIIGVLAIIICLLMIFFGGRAVGAVKDLYARFVQPDAVLAQTVQSAETRPDIGGNQIPEDELQSLFAEFDTLTETNTDISGTSVAEVSSTTADTTVTTTKTQTTPKLTTTVPVTTKPATTTKPTTTTTTTKAPTTTTRPATSAVVTDTSLPSQTKGTFLFTVKGYGHGVGMSQRGARAYAEQGKDYKWILLHYYQPGVALEKDSSPPQKVAYRNTSYPLVEYVSRTVAQEIGPSSHFEALKAQAVAVYTFAKKNSFNMTANHHAFSYSFKMDENSNVVKAVRATLGEYLSYNGSPITAFYFSSCAGKTVSSASVWGGSLPYLQGGISSPESFETTTKSLTVEEFRAFVNDYNRNYPDKAITLQEDPAQWIKIIKTDSAGYVETVRVGDREMRGYHFRHDLLKLSIKSHCFTFTYTP